MGRLRYIEPELWDNPDLRRLGFVARDVFVYLFARAADDEGRFRWEPFAILEATFSRNDPVTEDNVQAALEGLAEAGMLVRYGERGEFGFLTGWFAHQAMDGRWRRVSNLPHPPVEVGSWAEADEARTAYSKALGKTGRNVSYRESLRWSREQHGTVSVESRENLARISRREGEGVEGKGSTTTPPQPLTPSATPATAEAALGLEGLEDSKLKRRKEDPEQLAIRETFETLTGQEWPGGTPKGYLGLLEAVQANTQEKLRAWAASGHSTTEHRSPKSLVGWYMQHARQAVNCPETAGWCRDCDWPRGTNGPLHGQPSPPPPWPSRFQTEDLVSQFTDDEIAELARAPDGDWYQFPWHNVNGTQQQRAERARRAYNREQASG